ncbi:MAG: LLM class flavin-dependent oxidoreductase, partial [Actinomycetota bacterium]
MRFGLALPQYGFSLPNGEVGFETTAAWARRAEELGFDSVWLSDHFFYTFARYGGDPAPIPAIEPMTALAALAAITSRVRLGTLVLCAPFRHPALLAKMAVTIDHLSGGRLDLGLGAGWLEGEFDAFGFPFGTIGERFTALEDALAALSALQSGEPATYVGSSVTLRDALLLPA